MTTKERADAAALIERYRQIVSRPLELVLDDAVAYWLEDGAGHRLGPESDRSLAPLFLALELARIRAAGRLAIRHPRSVPPDS
jgi:hypothetical protein